MIHMNRYYLFELEMILLILFINTKNKLTVVLFSRILDAEVFIGSCRRRRDNRAEVILN